MRWTPKMSQAALLLAEGQTRQATADALGVTRRSVQNWLNDGDFAAEVDRLTLMVGIAGRAERLRIAMRVARQRVREDGTVDTDRDILDWLKFAQGETDGIKLDLAALADAQASLADSRPDRVSPAPPRGNGGDRGTA